MASIAEAITISSSFFFLLKVKLLMSETTLPTSITRKLLIFFPLPNIEYFIACISFLFKPSFLGKFFFIKKSTSSLFFNNVFWKFLNFKFTHLNFV